MTATEQILIEFMAGNTAEDPGPLTADERRLINCLRSLNNEGRERIYLYSQNMRYINEYQKGRGRLCRIK